MTSHFNKNGESLAATEAVLASNQCARNGSLRWPEDETEVCRAITRAPSPLKVVLKTKNDPWMLPLWLEHYLGFLAPHEIIIADNYSTDPRVDEIYRSLHNDIILFKYKSNLENGFHNNIHCRDMFERLHLTLKKHATTCL